jgi:hypothetical protein
LWAPALLTNIRLKRKKIKKNTLAYFAIASVALEKGLITLTPEQWRMTFLGMKQGKSSPKIHPCNDQQLFTIKRILT